MMLKLYPDNNFFLEAGPQIGLAISHKEEFNGLFDISEEYEPNNFDWGGVTLVVDSKPIQV